jgi:hypothetical protein
MGHRQLRRLIEDAMRDKQWSQGNLAVAIGFLPSGKTLDATGVRRIITGERPLTPWMLNRLVDVLGLDPDEAESAALEDYRVFLQVGGASRSRADALTAASGTGSNPKLSARTRRRSPPIRHQRPYADNPLTRHA